MEDAYYSSFESTEHAELTAESTGMEPRDNIGVSSESIIPSASQCSEDDVLKCTFQACDPGETGVVSVFRIIEYLQEMTGQSDEDCRFQSLYRRLDPEERGIFVEFPTFCQAMKEWIAECQKEGEEGTDVTSSITDLQQGNKQLAMQNAKLQRTIETAEELNLRLSEEIADLKGKLRGNQQALEQARAMADELEDMKFFSRSLEEENRKLHMQGRQLEKEQHCLLSQADKLFDENQMLLQEKENFKDQIRQLSTEKAEMQRQLCECEELISCKNADLDKKEKQVEELTVTLDEYQMMVQELKSDVRRLQEQQGDSYEGEEVLLRGSPENENAYHALVPFQPLSVEIEESQQDEWREITEVTEIIEVTQVSTEFWYEAVPNDEPDWKKPGNKWCASLLDWFFDLPIVCLFLFILQKLVLPGLLLACVALLTIVYIVPPYGHHAVWSESRGNHWTRLRLLYLQLPPM
ncbi:protein KASH5-like [Paroedura picta]|uniref:protein KASH5-like n=1 Tax=Paroedura picta TaxID=143630 RepID=UPI004056104B